MKSPGLPAWFSWASLTLLAVLCAALGFLQYRWTGQITDAERTSLYEGLRSRLNALQRAFDENISGALAGLQPPAAEVSATSLEAAYAAQYIRWKTTRGDYFRQIAIALPRPDGALWLLSLDRRTDRFTRESWPPGWAPLRERLKDRLLGGPRMPPGPEDPNLLELPRFSEGREQEWLIVELNTAFLSSAVLPHMLSACLGSGEDADYDIDIRERGGSMVYSSSPPHLPVFESNADAAVPLLAGRIGGGPGREGPRPGPPPPPGSEWDRGPRPPPGTGAPGRWQVLVRHRAGSLEALVDRTRRRNLGISAAVLLLILITVSMLVRLSRQAQQLARMQIAFVAGVSHELRTPLTVIRTCAYNLRNPAFRSRTDQVERYGRLIESETGKLEAMVGQVLRFASGQAGRGVPERALISIGDVIAEEVELKRDAAVNNRVVLESRIADDLPLVMADENAFRHVLQNLLDNALKYGTSGNNSGGSWVGIDAQTVGSGGHRSLEIRIADRGPGIPRDEQAHIFEAFFRGRRALQDQVHGTGLGLNLVKTIVEAHGGTVHVKSEPPGGADFIVRLPAATS